MNDKEKILAEIERLRNFYELSEDKEHAQYEYDVKCGCDMALDDILSFINTLEVKEVNLEKHLKEDIEDVFFDLNGVAVKGATYYLTVEDVKDIAKHFFELGLKAKD